MTTFFIVTAIAISTLLISLGYIVLKKNYKSPTNILFFSFSLLTSLWLMASFLENLSFPGDLVKLFLHFDFLFGALGIFAAFAFLFNFPKPNQKFNRYLPLITIPIIFVLLTSFGDRLIYDINTEGPSLSFKYGPLFWLYALLLLSGIASGVINQFVQYHRIQGVGRMQIRYVLIGFFVIGLAATFNLFFQNEVSPDIFRLVNFSPIILFVCIFYAIARYHLMNIWLIVRLGAIFFVLLTIITTIYATAASFVSDYLQIGRPWNYLIPSILIILGFSRIKELVEKASDRVFFQMKYRFSDLAVKIEETIRVAGLNLDQALAGINEIVSNALKVDSSAVLVRTPEGNFIPRHLFGNKNPFKSLVMKRDSLIISYLRSHLDHILDREELLAGFENKEETKSFHDSLIGEMEKNKIFLAAPIKFENKLIGVYLLSNKLSNDYFSKEDFELISHVIWHLSFTINNGRIYEELKKLDEDKSRFISVVSHQFRTPLTASRYNLELCSDPGLPTKDKDNALKEAYESILILGDQLDHLLLVLEIEEGSVRLSKTRIEVKQLISNIISDSAALIAEKKINLQINLSLENPTVVADQGRIDKVLRILLTNAINYVFPGGKINLATKKEMIGDKQKLVFSLSDDGIGMSRESGKNLAKKFFRSQEAVSMSPNGFGLSLFIAKKIVEAHGGELWFEHGKTRGATFFFSLPL
jgi:signal transduction histidine kinase